MTRLSAQPISGRRDPSGNEPEHRERSVLEASGSTSSVRPLKLRGLYPDANLSKNLP